MMTDEILLVFNVCLVFDYRFFQGRDLISLRYNPVLYRMALIKVYIYISSLVSGIYD